MKHLYETLVDDSDAVFAHLRETPRPILLAQLPFRLATIPFVVALGLLGAA
jgi:hypothetical protein